MSIERDLEKLTDAIEEQGGKPTTGQAVMSGCLGVALIIKAVIILAMAVFMVWFLWACAEACSEAAKAAVLLWF